MTELAEWTSALCSDLGVDESPLDPALILEVARAVERTVAKPAAPLTAYLFADRGRTRVIGSRCRRTCRNTDSALAQHGLERLIEQQTLDKRPDRGSR